MHETLQPEPLPAAGGIAPDGAIPVEGVAPAVVAEGVASEAIVAEALSAEPVVATEAALAPNEPIEAELERRVEALEKKFDSPELEERITTRVLERLPQATSRWYSKLNPFRGATSVPSPSGWVVF